MQKTLRIVLVLVVAAMPLASANISSAAKEKTFSGTVTQIIGSQVYFKTSSAATYAAEVSHAPLLRKYGAPMQFAEIMVSDKIEIKGLLYNDNSISTSSFRDLSVYVHSGTFSGKIEAIDPIAGSFTMQGKEGLQTIRADSYTVFRKNSESATLKDLAPGMSVSVAGSWDRTKAMVSAKEVRATARLINIDLTGRITLKNNTGLTVIGDNQVIYGVDGSKADLQDKNGKTIDIGRFNVHEKVRVWGKHVSGSNQVTATKIKNMSLPR